MKSTFGIIQTNHVYAQTLAINISPQNNSEFFKNL